MRFFLLGGGLSVGHRLGETTHDQDEDTEIDEENDGHWDEEATDQGPFLEEATGGKIVLLEVNISISNDTQKI